MKNSILRSKILILQLALYPLPCQKPNTLQMVLQVLLTESEQFVHISALLLKLSQVLRLNISGK